MSPPRSRSPFTDLCEHTLRWSHDYRDWTSPCGVASLEYRGWPSCRECGVLVCEQHQSPGSLLSESEKYSCLCVACADAST